jgi:ribonuclease P protein subunit RPR2
MAWGLDENRTERLNFLFQATLALHRVRDIEPAVVSSLSRHYGSVLREVARKSVTTLSANVKKCLCLKCNALLIPGSTSTVRVRSRRAKHVVQSCNACGFLQRCALRRDNRSRQRRRYEREHAAMEDL